MFTKIKSCINAHHFIQSRNKILQHRLIGQWRPRKHKNYHECMLQFSQTLPLVVEN